MSNDTGLTTRLEALYTGAVHDVLRAMGHANCVLPSEIKALDPGKKLAGEVYTVSGHIDQTRDAHDTLVQWTGLLSKAPAGKVLVCQPNTHMVALMGELSAETLHYKNVRGYVVDGGCRDTELILNIGFPVFCSFNTPADIVGRWVPDRFGEPVTIGSVTIRSSDYILGDRDGVVVLPAEVASDAISRTEAVVATENKVRTAILDGMDPQQAYLKYGKF
ncbi:MAG: RraA family protein [Betaproteobacteria bacterium]|jgi:regulator of RNase E activity RraA|nr:MAG: RraA family protein [Betaproteobacteria bacterium]